MALIAFLVATLCKARTGVVHEIHVFSIGLGTMPSICNNIAFKTPRKLNVL